MKRWLKAPVQQTDGSLQPRQQGTPQGEVISLVLANLFLDYAFDRWIRRTYSDIEFERYVDDIIIDCNSKEQAQLIKMAVETRLAKCKLALHSQKTKIEYCGTNNFYLYTAIEF